MISSQYKGITFNKKNKRVIKSKRKVTLLLYRSRFVFMVVIKVEKDDLDVCGFYNNVEIWQVSVHSRCHSDCDSHWLTVARSNFAGRSSRHKFHDQYIVLNIGQGR